jgi:hypothetical protein
VLRQALDGGPESVREVPGRAWKIAGRDVTLATIEELLRAYREPRVHLALYRGTRGGPPLVFFGGDLDEALDRQARAFLADRSRNRFDYAGLSAELSELLLWHRDELAAGREGEVDPFQLFLAEYAPDPYGDGAIARSLRKVPWRIAFRPYDRSLDDARAEPRRVHPAWFGLYALVAIALLLLGLRAIGPFLRPPAPAPPHPPGG